MHSLVCMTALRTVNRGKQMLILLIQKVRTRRYNQLRQRPFYQLTNFAKAVCIHALWGRDWKKTVFKTDNVNKNTAWQLPLIWNYCNIISLCLLISRDAETISFFTSCVFQWWGSDRDSAALSRIYKWLAQKPLWATSKRYTQHIHSHIDTCILTRHTVRKGWLHSRASSDALT